MANILIINGHPDADPRRLCAGLARACAEGAKAGGHAIRVLELGRLDFPLIESRQDFEHTPPPPVIAEAQESILWANHLILIFPIWMGGTPALVRAFLEQTFRYGFALAEPGSDKSGGLLRGRSARLFVTMGMPAVVYRLAFGAFGVRAIERGILRLAGIAPIHRTLMGGVEAATDATRAGWLETARRLAGTAS
ncbi:MAG: NAD(P)H-dependent oxidoreductase [Caulobacter sp.]